MHKVAIPRQEWVRGLRSQARAAQNRCLAAEKRGARGPPGGGGTRPRRVPVGSPGGGVEGAAAGGVTAARPA